MLYGLDFIRRLRYNGTIYIKRYVAEKAVPDESGKTQGDDGMIRTMTMDDYKAVFELWMNTSNMGLNNVDDSEAGIARFLSRNPDTCFTAETDGKIVGAIMAGNDGRRGYIYHTAVHPDYRKQGIGTTLVDAALDALKQIGITKVALVVFRRNEDGNAFWEKQGFTERTDLTYRNKTLTEMERYDT